MVKKILGGLFFAVAVLSLIGAAINGNLTDNIATTIGTLIPVVLYVFSGIFLIAFDGAAKLGYIEGFKKRSAQSSLITAFVVAYGILTLIVAVGIGASLPENFFLAFIIAVFPYMIPLIIFVGMLQMYALPYRACKKYYLGNEAALNYYLSAGETFYTYSPDNFVLASSKALFFPRLLCAVPFNQITGIKLSKQLWEQDVYINLANGKKLCIVTKHYDRIAEAINANTAVR